MLDYCVSTRSLPLPVLTLLSHRAKSPVRMRSLCQSFFEGEFCLRIKFVTFIAALTVGVGFAGFAVKIVIDHNSGSEANGSFKFKNVAPPAKDDLGAKAKLTLVDGAMDSNGADLSALTDGLLPTEEDQPSANFFFDERTDGGRFRMDLGSAVELSQINTYSL